MSNKAVGVAVGVAVATPHPRKASSYPQVPTLENLIMPSQTNKCQSRVREGLQSYAHTPPPPPPRHPAATPTGK